MKHILITTALLSIVTTAQANPAIEKNGVLASKDGRTLYTFDKDSGGRSTCNGGCAAAWPPFAVANPALAGGDFSILRRDDGSQQWAWKGMPLYFYVGDAKPGDITGDNQGGVWHVLRGDRKAAASGGGASSRSEWGY
ncbi:COG4315 family predicted lipoprotein [Uliginosibacterium sp. H1]|uniref:COG4315 family predicted lipoprotein n=1 Tax=Uliginosibacterium sp. H1 TaxID=3114757 RepID=UPI002E18E5E5|nr:hypothetical protein [Uliginosibacterium sp. H1]